MGVYKIYEKDGFPIQIQDYPSRRRPISSMVLRYEALRRRTAFIFIYSVGDIDSVEFLREEVQAAKRYGIPSIIVGNKSDLGIPQPPLVGKALAMEFGFPFRDIGSHRSKCVIFL
eukprot:gnl/Carplike_NY0171/920_a1263_1721.p1 GENE.gnl/Carplike_NY0171/920_a1263_1721~~gnl/Carplike_NY0171/920_a1263_1721.p1  ORF type:complete len:115 (-),score=9.87 gnl/Carplike_NY0171/920_a1263_1721:217-561(-)